jgi:hypothetical protein
MTLTQCNHRASCEPPACLSFVWLERCDFEISAALGTIPCERGLDPGCWIYLGLNGVACPSGTQCYYQSCPMSMQCPSVLSEAHLENTPGRDETWVCLNSFANLFKSIKSLGQSV